MPKKVSVIIPNFNQSFWILDAIESIDTQDYPNKEIIVVDDGSTDSDCSVNNIEALIQNAKNEGLFVSGTFNNTPIKFAKYKKNRGPSAARNYGLNLVEDSEYIAFLDADDYYLQGKLSKSIEILNKPGIHFVYTDCIVKNIDYDYEYRNYLQSFDVSKLKTDCVAYVTGVLKKNVFDVVVGFDEQLSTCEDYDFWLRVGEHFLGAHIPEALFTIRVGKHSTINTIPKETWMENQRKALDKCKKQ